MRRFKFYHMLGIGVAATAMLTGCGKEDGNASLRLVETPAPKVEPVTPTEKTKETPVGTHEQGKQHEQGKEEIQKPGQCTPGQQGCCPGGCCPGQQGGCKPPVVTPPTKPPPQGQKPTGQEKPFEPEQKPGEQKPVMPEQKPSQPETTPAPAPTPAPEEKPAPVEG